LSRKKFGSSRISGKRGFDLEEEESAVAVAVAVVNPKQARDFAKEMGRLATFEEAI
jgi:hypothetical protein